MRKQCYNDLSDVSPNPSQFRVFQTGDLLATHAHLGIILEEKISNRYRTETGWLGWLLQSSSSWSTRSEGRLGPGSAICGEPRGSAPTTHRGHRAAWRLTNPRHRVGTEREGSGRDRKPDPEAHPASWETDTVGAVAAVKTGNAGEWMLESVARAFF
jgi:hypothetical protein